jgi:hypothetical protein
MTPENFAYWLQGFVELTQGQTPNPAQWKSIQEHLGEVFKKVTPPVGVEQKITAPADADWDKFFRDWRVQRPNDFAQWPYTVTCTSGYAQSDTKGTLIC